MLSVASRLEVSQRRSPHCPGPRFPCCVMAWSSFLQGACGGLHVLPRDHVSETDFPVCQCWETGPLKRWLGHDGSALKDGMDWCGSPGSGLLITRMTLFQKSGQPLLAFHVPFLQPVSRDDATRKPFPDARTLFLDVPDFGKEWGSWSW